MGHPALHSDPTTQILSTRVFACTNYNSLRVQAGFWRGQVAVERGFQWGESRVGVEV
jgi:hypothetical protein